MPQLSQNGTLSAQDCSGLSHPSANSPWIDLKDTPATIPSKHGAKMARNFSSTKWLVTDLELLAQAM